MPSREQHTKTQNLSGLNELVDFDDLEIHSDTVVFDDDAGQAKG